MGNLKKIYVEAQRRLKEAGVDNSGFDAGCIIEKHTGIKRHEIVLRDESLSERCLEAFWADIARRERREPLQYIVGTWPFYGLDFFVGDGVLIPRPDTGILVEEAIDFLKRHQSPRILDLCAGSGCISTAVLKNVENSSAVCLELSNNAAFYLKKNLDFHGLSHCAQIVNADMLSQTTAATLSGEFDALLSNPPYIKSCDIASLEPEVAEYEPRLALDGGADGLTFYRAAGLYLPLLKDGGMAAFEVGIGEAFDVAAILEGFGLHGVFVKKDYGGIERVVGGFR